MSTPALYHRRNERGIVGWLARRWLAHRVRVVKRGLDRARR